MPWTRIPNLAFQQEHRMSRSHIQKDKQLTRGHEKEATYANTFHRFWISHRSRAPGNEHIQCSTHTQMQNSWQEDFTTATNERALKHKNKNEQCHTHTNKKGKTIKSRKLPTWESTQVTNTDTQKYKQAIDKRPSLRGAPNANILTGSLPNLTAVSGNKHALRSTCTSWQSASNECHHFEAANINHDCQL